MSAALVRRCFTHQTMMDGRGEEQARNGGVRGRGAPIAQDNHVDAVANVGHDFGGDVIEGAGQPLGSGARTMGEKEAVDGHRAEAFDAGLLRRCSESSIAHEH